MRRLDGEGHDGKIPLGVAVYHRSSLAKYAENADAFRASNFRIEGELG
jgi:hypothetical protein